MNYDQKKSVVGDAIRLMSVISSHLSESNCQHTIKQIASEALNVKSEKDNESDIVIGRLCERRANDHHSIFETTETNRGDRIKHNRTTSY